MLKRSARLTCVCSTLLFVFLTAPLGCKKEEVAAPAGQPTGSTASTGAPAAQTFENVSFQAPAGWKAQSTGSALLNLVGPQDGDWEPNIALKTYENKKDESVDEILSQAQEGLARKSDFESKGRQSPVSAPNGFQYGRLAYMSKNDVTSQIALFQWYVVVSLPNKRWLEIQASAPAEARDRYEGVFQKFVDSISIQK